MVSEIGGLGSRSSTAGRTGSQRRFTALWGRGRLDLTVETLVLSNQYRELFSDDEREGAAARLVAYRRPND